MTDTQKAEKENEDLSIQVHNAENEDSGEGDGRFDVNQAPEAQEDEELSRETKLVPIGDGGRSAIAEKFKASRADKAKPVDATGDFNDPSQMYGAVANEDDQPQDNPPKEVSSPPEKLTLKVRGNSREVDREEALRLAKAVAPDEDIENLSDQTIVRLAQIGAAGNEYLNNAREILETTRARVEVSRHHPDERKPAQTPTDNNEGEDDGNTPADPLAKFIEQVQYGDPGEAREILNDTINEAVGNVVKQRSETQRFDDDRQRDLIAYDEFVKKNSDIATDEIAVSVVRDALQKGYVEDLRKIGVPEDKIPTDPTMLADHHRYYKLKGHPVRQVPTLLEESAQRLREWRGNKQPGPSPTPQPKRDVRVNVQRDERRQAIPHQPTRANVQPQLNPSRPPARSRADVVQRAKQLRGQV